MYSTLFTSKLRILMLLPNSLRHVVIALIALLIALPTTAQTTYVPTADNLAARQRFAESRFGIFLHWGLYSLYGQGEWFMTDADVDCHEYAKAAEAFYPHNFDTHQWVSAIKDAGAGYLCFTSRHHEGFSMWDTQQSDYKITRTPYGRDIVRQLADACHEQNIGLHLYYSHLDWTRADYPIGRTGHNTGRTLRPDWPAYYRFMNAQLTELLTQYGRVDCIWFDGWWDHDHDSVPFNWQLEEQYALIHRLQPACLIGNNHHQTPYAGEDIQIFERDVPGENTAGLSGQAVSRLPLETCQTMNGMWGYKVRDTNYKSATTLIRLLARTASKSANLLLNIGPQPDGSLPAAALDRLRDIGVWMRHYGTSIRGTEGLSYDAGGDSIVCTRRADTVFVHVLSPTVREVKALTLPVSRIKSVTALTDGRALPYSYRRGSLNINGLTISTDCADYVIRVVTKGFNLKTQRCYAATP